MMKMITEGRLEIMRVTVEGVRLVSADIIDDEHDTEGDDDDDDDDDGGDEIGDEDYTGREGLAHLC